MDSVWWCGLSYIHTGVSKILQLGSLNKKEVDKGIEENQLKLNQYNLVLLY